jgi:hypothetical protein
MRMLTENEIRGSFVNCSKGEARRLRLPRDLGERPWADLDFLGWRDPGSPEHAYLVIELDQRPVGLTLRAPSPGTVQLGRPGLCAMCVMAHDGSGIDLMTAARVGEPGRQGNTAGTYICADLACSLYLRGKKKSPKRRSLDGLSTPERVARLQTNVARFVTAVTSDPGDRQPATGG